MISRVLISRQLLASFRKLAMKAYPNEGMQTLWGRIEGDTAIITALRTPEQVGSEEELEINTADMYSPQRALRGEHFIGTIHSHPNCDDCGPSEHDWGSAYSAGERIFAVMRIERKDDGKFKTEVAFWEPRPPIKIVSPRVRKNAISSALRSEEREALSEP